MIVFAAPLSAYSATLPIRGNFGSESGCRLATTGEYEPVDDVYLLTPDSLGTSVTLCSFTDVKSAPDGKLTVDMNCASEGEEGETADSADISGNAQTGYKIHFADGNDWGPLKKCL